MGSEVKAVVFDIGNVLIEWHPGEYYERKIGAEARDRLFAEVPLDDMNRRSDLGANMADEVVKLAESYPDWAEEILLWRDGWLEIASPPIDHSVHLLRALRKNGVPVFALTNFGVQTFELAAGVYPFFREFDREYVSGRLGVMKPDARIYEIVEQDSGLSGAELLFADDGPANIAAAEARGWQAHLFEGPEGWAARLVREGLLSKADAVF